jgi:hypothetical protein
VPIGNNTANCTTASGISYAGKNIAHPYECDPENLSTPCLIVYNVTSPNGTLSNQRISVPCGCGLDGNSGYCSKLLGLPEY